MRLEVGMMSTQKEAELAEIDDIASTRAKLRVAAWKRTKRFTARLNQDGV